MQSGADKPTPEAAKPYLRLRGVLVQQSLQFFVFEFFRRLAMLLVVKVEITRFEVLEPFLTSSYRRGIIAISLNEQLMSGGGVFLEMEKEE